MTDRKRHFWATEIKIQGTKKKLVQSFLSLNNMVTNTAARLVSEARRFNHVAPLLHGFHWRLAESNFQNRCVEMRPLHSAARSYLRELCVPVNSERGHVRLQSTSTSTDVKRTKDFCFLWDSLSSAVCDNSLSINAFKQTFKTHLFLQWWTSSDAAVALLWFWRRQTSVLSYF